MNLTLALSGYLLLLISTAGSLAISWKQLRMNDVLHGKVDWLRRALVNRDASIRSYQSVGRDADSGEWSDTVAMPPPLPPRNKR